MHQIKKKLKNGGKRGFTQRKLLATQKLDSLECVPKQA